MKVTTVEYSKVFNLGEYQNEKIGVVISVGDDEDPNIALTEAKKIVEFSSANFKRDLENAKDIIAHPDNHTIRAVKRAEELVIFYEEGVMKSSNMLKA
jgi:hypothetical protein